MALDPTIPLGVRPPQGPAQMNPIEMIGQWAQIQNAINQNRLFQQTFAARQMAGQILSNAPDLESGLDTLLKNPVTAPFAGETINAVRQSQLTQTQIAGEVQKQADSAISAFSKALPALYADPSDEVWNNLVSANLSTLSPIARAKAAPAIDSLRKALLDGLPEDPDKKTATFRNRLTGLMIASGSTPDTFKSLAGGQPKELDLGGAVQPGFETFGGKFTPTGPAYGKTIAPGIFSGPGGIGQPFGGSNNLLGPVPAPPPGPEVSGPTNALGGTPTTGPRVIAAPIAPPRSTAIPPAGATGPTAGAAVAPASQGSATDISPIPRGPNGAAIFPQGAMQAPPTARGLGNMPLLAPSELKRNEKLQEEFAGDGAKEYNNAVQSLSSLRYMENALDEAAKRTGSFSDRFLTPGAFAESRANIAQTYNTLAAMAGQWDPNKPQSETNKAPFNPNTIASLEDFQKETKRMGLMVLTTFLGAQREAAQTIQGITASVPGISNTYLGGKLVADSIRGAMQRVVDRRQFMNQWSNLHQDDLRGAAEKFDELYPAEVYADRVLGKYGLLESGFRTPQDLINAVRNGWINPADGAAIGKKQFPGGPR